MRRIRIPWFKGHFSRLSLGLGMLLAATTTLTPEPLQARTLAVPDATSAADSPRITSRDLLAENERLNPARQRLEALETLKQVTLARLEVEKQLKKQEKRLPILTRGDSLELALCAHDWLNQAQVWMAFLDASDKLAWEALGSDELEQFQNEVRRSRFGLERSVQALEQFKGCERTWVTNDGVRVTVDTPSLNGGVASVERLLPGLGHIPSVYPVKPYGGESR